MNDNFIIDDLTQEEVISLIWNKGTQVDGYDPEVYRKDAAGAWIMRSMHGKRSGLGWEIDHVFPKERGGQNHYINLRPMHWRNNLSKSDDYPSYKIAVSSVGNNNEYKDEYRTVNEKLRNKLAKLYD